MIAEFKIQQEQGFYLDRDKASMPNVSGIYVVYSCDYDSYSDTVNVKDILYIGEADNIGERHNGTPYHFKNHEHYDDFVKAAGGADHICYGVVPIESFSEEERKWIQDAMIFFQKPPINTGKEKDNYIRPSIDLTMEDFPNCWKTTRILLEDNPS